MKPKLTTKADAEAMIQSGECLLLAGDEKMLSTLPTGNWIGGSIPYFMSAQGGTISKDQVFVTPLPSYIGSTTTSVYDSKSIESVYVNSPKNGFSFIIIPALSEIHASFAINAPKFKDFACRPLIGWISGVHLDDLGKVAPRVFDGKTGKSYTDRALVLAVNLPEDRICDMGIVNIFSQGNGDTLEFSETGFSVKDVLVNGTKTNFAQYLLKNKTDVKLPLVANYCGANINISFQSIDEKNGVVNFYAPVFAGVQYRQASSVTNYVEEFKKGLPSDSDEIAFSCNCILNFLYSELEGKKTGNIVGPITFGEIAYQLLNQTMVYLTIQKV